MVGQKRPGKTIGLRIGNQLRQPLNKFSPVVIGTKNPPPFNAPDDHVLQRPGAYVFAEASPQRSILTLLTRKGSACILPIRFSLYTNKFSQVPEKYEKNWCVKITITLQHDIIKV